MKEFAGPREKLLHLGAEALGDDELLAVLISAGTRKESVFDISRRLVREHGLLALSCCRDVRRLASACGLGTAKAGQLLAAMELGRRLWANGSSEFPILRHPREVAVFLAPMARLQREQFRCLYLSTIHKLIHEEVISVGSLNSSLVHPREVFHYAIHYRAASILLAHNHPSGHCEPSQDDLSLTRQLVSASKIIGIDVMDHVIISSGGWFSFREQGLLHPAKERSPDVA